MAEANPTVGDATTIRKKPTCKKCGELQLGHVRKRHLHTNKKIRYPCDFTATELDEMDKAAALDELYELDEPHKLDEL